MTTLSDIEKLVETTAKQALQNDTSLQDRVDALKILHPYYAALKKAEGLPAEGGDEPTIADMQAQIEKENGNGRNVQARTRSRN